MKDNKSENLQKALEYVRVHGKSLRAAAKEYCVSFSTLQRHYKNSTISSKRGRKPAMSREAEEKVSEAVEYMATAGHPCTRKEVIELAGKMNEQSNNKIFKNKNPSLKWWRGFKKRNNLTLKTSQNVSAAQQKIEFMESKNESFDRVE